MLYVETVSPFSLMGLGCLSCDPRDPPISTHTLALGLQTWDTVPDFARGFWGLNSGTDAGHTKHLLVTGHLPSSLVLIRFPSSEISTLSSFPRQAYSYPFLFPLLFHFHLLWWSVQPALDQTAY